MIKIYEQTRWCGALTAKVDESKCRAQCYDEISRRFYQCSRKPKREVEGHPLCTQHAKKVENEGVR